MEKIAESAFESCSSLRSVTFINTNEISIGESSFEGCVILETVTLGENINTIGNSAFKSSAVKQIVIPRSVKTFLKYFLLCLQKEFARQYASVHHIGSLELKQLDTFLTTIGENIQVVAEEHPELMGGIKVQHGDNIWDFSIQGQLQALMKTLK